jgi:hypothetical protein
MNMVAFIRSSEGVFPLALPLVRQPQTRVGGVSNDLWG